MPENPKSSQTKNKNEPKEQRRKRQNRHPPGPGDKNVEKEVAKSTVSAAEKSVPSEPSPEFYKNLKRETDEILKITEEENSKYKKKEILSNWAKYEMPIESYEEIDEQESIGADFESLLQASLSVGGHFQFKHERSWDVTTGPSPYDKYFDINMDTLNLGLSTIPFHERNDIDTTLFTESDMIAMDHRATKFKNKYYNDTKYTTPEIEAGNKILNIISSSANESNEGKHEMNKAIIGNVSAIHLDSNKDNDNKQASKEVILQDKNVHIILESQKDLPSKQDVNDALFESSLVDKKKKNENNTMDDKELPSDKEKLEAVNVAEKSSKNPAIESPEDLEKWLDDFLDG